MSDDGYSGLMGKLAANNRFNEQSNLIRSLINKIATVEIVQVKAVNGDFVSVQPMVSQVDGNGVGYDHGIIANVPIFRLQGGNGAVKLTPVVGDIGIAVFSAHDFSTVKSTRAPAVPGSRRRFDWADAIYFGGILNDAPTRYVEMTDSALNIVDPNTVTITAPGVNVHGDFSVTGNLSVSGNTTLGSGAVKFVMLADMTPSTTVKAK